MGRILKELFYRLAYLDLERFCNKKNTYFGRFSKEIGMKNLGMIRSISVFLSIICVFVIISTYTYFDGVDLRNLYFIIWGVEVAVATACTILMKIDINHAVCTLITSLYLLHMLVIGGYIGVVFSKVESATVFVAVLVISSMIFTLPPILSASISLFATVGTLIASYFVKDIYWFQSDVINCVGVLILSMLLGWRVNKIRAEEAFARAHALELNEKLHQVSVTDQLTGLPNHRSFQNTYYRMFEDARAAGSRIGVIMMDLDKFKSYNDNYGHVKGDICLGDVARAFSEHIRDGVTVCRYGGEEFIVLLSDCVCDNAGEIAEEFRKAVEDLAITHAFSDVGNVVTVSLGLYIGTPVRDDKPMSFVDCADRAMYLSKREGRNRFTCLTL